MASGSHLNTTGLIPIESATCLAWSRIVWETKIESRNIGNIFIFAHFKPEAIRKALSTPPEKPMAQPYGWLRQKSFNLNSFDCSLKLL